MNATIYTRVASENPPVLARRVEACREYARQHAFTITREYTDIGPPGGAFIQLVVDAAEHDVTDVVTDDPIRFGLSITGFIANVDTLHGLGVAVHTPTGDVSPGRNFTRAHQNAAHIIGAIAVTRRSDDRTSPRSQ